MKKWLITYSQWTGYQYKTANTTSDSHPADWLNAVEQRHPEAQTLLLFAIEINEQQYTRLRDNVCG